MNPVLDHPHSHAHAVREATTMAIYVALCLLAVLIARDDPATSTREGLELVWGTAIGLALAHWFAFQASGRLLGAGEFTRLDAWVAAWQLSGATFAAVIVSVPIVILPASAELDAARLTICGALSLGGYTTAVTAGASRTRALACGFAVLTLASLIAAVKNGLAGH